MSPVHRFDVGAVLGGAQRRRGAPGHPSIFHTPIGSRPPRPSGARRRPTPVTTQFHHDPVLLEFLQSGQAMRPPGIGEMVVPDASHSIRAIERKLEEAWAQGGFAFLFVYRDILTDEKANESVLDELLFPAH